MTALQIFLLGIMVAWTPSAVLLAWLIYRTPLAADDSSESQTDQPAATLVPSDSTVSTELPTAQSDPDSASPKKCVCKTA
jgi:hypothetical protein